MQKTLCFFTANYPYGTGETFIENELYFIAPHFEKVYLFHKNKTDAHRSIPKNVELIYIEPPINSKLVAVKNLFLLLSFLFQELFFSRQKQLFISNIKYNLNHFLNCIYYAEQIKNKLSLDIRQNAVFYSYWFFDWNLSLSILKKRNRIKHNVTRAHGFDLYENNGKPNYLPVRKFCLQHTDKVFVISKTGEEYLKHLYPKFSDKIFCSRLGTKDYGVNPISNSNTVHIVSCSNVIEVKRLHLIIKILKNVTAKIIWTHFGDGKLLEEIKQKAKELPNNVQVNFKGRQTQQEIFDFYTKAPVDIFINVSESEGIPVSIMEAISFGIPVIATDVGGISEIINTQTGWLIAKEFDANEVANYVQNIKSNKNIDRKIIRDYWLNNFEYQKNYNDFLELM
ncbi:MAG: glycosyltransferase [Bacteroidetes bacterium]|nr:glycosyltransferase [Bacteroidota bacterium]